jgi:hypothetical protein
MDVRKSFTAVSKRLMADFEATEEVKHTGGRGTLREEALKDFLQSRIPKRYAVGAGEVVTPDNRTSGQLDVVIFDDFRFPRLSIGDPHSVFPVEGVYGAISVRSSLESNDLQETYQNIVSLKEILPTGGVQHRNNSGFAWGMHHPIPVTGIFAYRCRRSLEAVAAQAKELDSGLSDIRLRPDFIVVSDEGIIGPREPLRGSFNSYNLPSDRDLLVLLRKTGRHTLLRFYMQIISELERIELSPFDLRKYDEMPRLVGRHRVKGGDRFLSSGAKKEGQQLVRRLNAVAIEQILRDSVVVTVRDLNLHQFGFIPPQPNQIEEFFASEIFEYNPKHLPPIPIESITFDEFGKPLVSEPYFSPTFINIDGKDYAVDTGSFSDEHFEQNPDYTAEELFAI